MPPGAMPPGPPGPAPTAVTPTPAPVPPKPTAPPKPPLSPEKLAEYEAELKAVTAALEETGAIQKMVEQIVGMKVLKIDKTEFQKIITDVGMRARKLDKIEGMPADTDKIARNASESGSRLSKKLMEVYQGGMANNAVKVRSALDETRAERKTKFDEYELELKKRQDELKRLIAN
jgi:hypothetical protein